MFGDYAGDASGLSVMERIAFIFITWVIFLASMPVWSVYGEPLPDIVVREESRFNVAVISKSIPIYLYKNIPPQANVDVSRLKSALLNQIDHHPYLRLIDQDAMNEAFKGIELKQTDVYMQAEIDMGYARSFMDNMIFSSAIDILKRVIDNYQKSLARYIQPKNVIQAYQQFAYALIGKYQENPEEGLDNLHPARLAFLELFRLAPYLSMIEGRQSKDRVALYNEALELFLSNEFYRQVPREDAVRLAYHLDAEILLFPRIIQDKEGGVWIEIDVFMAREKSLKTLRKKLEFEENIAPDVVVSDDATWLLSNIYDCLIVARDEEAPKNRLRHHFSMTVGMTYSSHLRHPTDDFLNNVGGYVFFSFMFDEHFFFRLGSEIQEVLQDKSHDLYDSFEIYHFPIMIGILKEWDWFRLYAALGLDFGFSSTFITTTSISCKTFGLDDVECSQSDVSKWRDPFSLTFDVVLGVSLGRDPFYFNLEGFANPTLYPTEDKQFRHLIGMRMGVQYWF